MRARSVSEFAGQVDAAFGHFAVGDNFDLWFRGVKDASYPLVASADRRPCPHGEDSVCAEFLIHAPGLLAGKALPTDPWEVYALMQHHRVPTRLLDWSRAPLMALYFAVETEASDHTDGKVSVLNPVALNQTSLGKAEILSCVRPEARDYLPHRLQQMKWAEPFRALPDTAAAFEAPMSNLRIAAQRGCFTVSGRLTDSIPSAPTALVAEVTIPAADKPVIRAALRHLGLCEDSVYQDLDSLAARIVREYF